MTQHDDALRTAGLAGREDWRAAAACRFADPDLFFPVSDVGKGLDQAVEAKAICAGCRVRRQCLAFALRTRQVHGIWGGLTERERYVLAASPRPRWRYASSADGGRRARTTVRSVT